MQQHRYLMFFNNQYQSMYLKSTQIKPHLIPQFYNLHDVPTTAIYLQLTEKYGCDILLMFESCRSKQNRSNDDYGFIH